jgi:hypothetical protein
VQTSYAAKIMAISVFPFIIVQIPQIFKLQSGHRLTVLLGLIVAALLVLAYCLYQVLCRTQENLNSTFDNLMQHFLEFS